MATQKFSNAEFRIGDVLDTYSQTYLRQYWPEVPESPIGWSDNAVLMLAYQEAALAVNNFFGGRPVPTLDVSTGPALAPLLAMLNCVSTVQLSDYHEDNRTCIKKMPIEYWRNYVPMLIRLFESPERQVPEILGRLDALRSESPPVHVDLFDEKPFGRGVNPHDYDLISMHFVADGITSNERDFLRCLGKVTDMVKPGAAFMMSATVDCAGWQLGGNLEPSPMVSEQTIRNFLLSQGMSILYGSRSMRQSGLTYTGGWVVLSAAKNAR